MNSKNGKTWVTMRRGTSFFLAFCLAICLLAPSIRADSGDGFAYPEKEHTQIEFSKMDPDSLFSMESFNKTLESFRQDAQSGNSASVRLLYENLMRQYDGIETACQIYSIRQSMDVSNSEISKKLTEYQSNSLDAYLSLAQTLKETLAGPSGDTLRVMLTSEEVQALEGFEMPTDEQKQRSLRETEISDSLYDQHLSEGDYEACNADLDEMLQLYQQDAADAGYDNYIDYLYSEIYYRDYSREEARKLWDIAKKEVMPLYAQTSSLLYSYSSKYSEEEQADTTSQDIIENIDSYIQNISPALTEAFDYLKVNDLYYYGGDSSGEKAGYTTGLPAYGSAYIYDGQSLTEREATETLVHEFGHFNNYYHDPTHAFWSLDIMDVAEIQSQGLEALFIPCWSEIEDSDGSAAYMELYVLDQLLYGIIFGTMIDEFEQRVAENGTMTLQEKNLLYKEICEDYGYDESSYPDGDDTWIEIPHIFSAPGYCISYATSAFSALDLWAMSEEDYDEAVSTYLAISAMYNCSYEEVLSASGLRDMTEAKNCSAVLDDLKKEIQELKKTMNSAFGKQTQKMGTQRPSGIRALWESIVEFFRNLFSGKDAEELTRQQEENTQSAKEENPGILYFTYYNSMKKIS